MDVERFSQLVKQGHRLEPSRIDVEGHERPQHVPPFLQKRIGERVVFENPNELIIYVQKSDEAAAGPLRTNEVHQGLVLGNLNRGFVGVPGREPPLPDALRDGRAGMVTGTDEAGRGRGERARLRSGRPAFRRTGCRQGFQGPRCAPTHDGRLHGVRARQLPAAGLDLSSPICRPYRKNYSRFTEASA